MDHKLCVPCPKGPCCILRRQGRDRLSKSVGPALHMDMAVLRLLWTGGNDCAIPADPNLNR